MSYLNFNLKNLNLPLLGVALIFDLFLLANGQAIFGPAFEAYQTPLGVYLALITGSMVISNSVPEIQIGIEQALLVFIPVFVIMVVIFSQLFRVPPNNAPLGTVILTIIFYVMLVGLSEEIVFRGAIFQLFGGNITAVFIQAVLFALFHISAYTTVYGTLSVSSVLQAFAFGLIMGFIVYYAKTINRMQYGIAVTWAIHSAYDLSLSIGIFVVAFASLPFGLHFLV